MFVTVHHCATDVFGQFQPLPFIYNKFLFYSFKCGRSFLLCASSIVIVVEVTGCSRSWGYRVYCSHYILNFPLSLVLSTFFKSSSICLNVSIPLCALLSESSYHPLRLLISASLTLSWRRSLSYRNQSIDLQSKSMAWFLYDNGLRHERVNYHESLSGNAKMYFFRFSLYYRATSGFSFSLLMILIHPTILMFITHPDIHQRGLGKFYIGFTKFTLNILVIQAVWKVSVFGVFLVRILPHSGWIRRDIPYIFVFSPTAGKYEPENFRKRTLSRSVNHQVSSD